MGATPIQAFMSTLLPLMMPGLVGATLIVFVVSLGSFTTPAALGAPGDVVLSVLVAFQVQRVVDWGLAAALGVLLLLLAMIAFAALAYVGGVGTLYGGSAARWTMTARPRRRLSGTWTSLTVNRRVGGVLGRLEASQALSAAGRFVLTVAAAALVFYMIMPLIVAIPASFTSTTILLFPPHGFSLQWYATFFTDEMWTSATSTSVIVGILSALVATALALCVAMVLVRGSLRWKSQLFALALAPLIMPWMITALGLYFQNVALGTAFTIQGVVIGHVVLTLPFSVVILTASLSEFNWDLDRAALASGANAYHRLRDVLGPYLRPALLSSLMFAFITSFTEVIYALLMSSIHLRTLPVSMWQGIIYSVNPTIAAAGGVLTAFTLSALGIALAVRGRSLWKDSKRAMTNASDGRIP